MAKKLRVGKKRPLKAKKARGVKTSGRRNVALPRVEDGPSDLAQIAEEQEFFRKTLADNKQLSRKKGPLPPGVTHQVEKDPSGSPRVVRKRFSAL